MSAIAVREERPGDIAAVRSVVEASFQRAAEADLVDSLRRYDDTLILVAEADGEIAGCIVFSRVVAAGGVSMAIAGLGPMGIAPLWQRQGVGTLLMNEGLDTCERRGIGAVVVVGHPEYYRRFGFSPANVHGITCKWVVPEDAFMVKELRPGALARVTGRVEYRPEFDEV